MAVKSLTCLKTYGKRGLGKAAGAATHITAARALDGL